MIGAFEGPSGAPRGLTTTGSWSSWMTLVAPLSLIGAISLLSCVFVPLIWTWPRPGRTVTVRRPLWPPRWHCRRRLPRAPRVCRIRLHPFGGRSVVPITLVGVGVMFGQVVRTSEMGRSPFLGGFQVRRWLPFPYSLGTGPPN